MLRLIHCFAFVVIILAVVVMNPISSSAQNETSAAAESATGSAAGTLALANNKFAVELMRVLGGQSTENCFLSPYSISTALGMTWAGARGGTADQMASVLHFSELPAGDVTSSFRAMARSLEETQKQTGAQLAVANSLWPEQQPEHPFLPAYIKQVQIDFVSEVTPLDYRNNLDTARQTINRWVESKTHDKIKDLLHSGDLDAATRLVLVNAIYFKAAWEDPFQPRANLNDQFHLADGTSKPVVLMRATRSVRYLQTELDSNSVQVMLLPYRRGAIAGGNSASLSFVAILPKEPSGLAALEKSLSAESLNRWLSQVKMERVQLLLPKFKLQARYSLNDALAAMGIRDAFVDPVTHASDPHRADFSGMNGTRDLYISKAIHQTFVDLDENGTEAAAATAIVMRAGAAFQQPQIVFRADHPFLFLIRDDLTGSILFMGRLADPPPAPESPGAKEK
jgi:serpin B